MSRTDPSWSDPGDLVTDADGAFKVHPSVYTDEQLFARELRDIFEHHWVYIGHESEVPEPGDFKTAMIGARPIILTRGEDGRLHGLLNVCRHRANAVCREQRGNATRFRCPYHGWTYRNDGALVGVPDRARYAGGFDSDALGLLTLPKLDTCRGLVFASLSADVPALEEHLSPVRHHIDLWADRSIGAEHAVLLPHRYGYHGNWKFQCENGVDGYHPGIVHESAFSSFAAFGIGNFERGPFVIQEETTLAYPGGHSVLQGGEHDGRGLARGLPHRYEEYVAKLNRHHGTARASEVIANRHLFIFPNVFLFDELVRVVQPMAVDYTEVYSHPFSIAGMPEDFNARRLYETTRQLSTTGLVNPSDLEMFAANQTGLRAGPDWLRLDRGIEDEEVRTSGERVGRYADETPQRAFHRRWVEVLVEAEAGA